jgi:predicted metal-binding protein
MQDGPTTIIHVCVTCREAGEIADPSVERPGARLWRSLSAAALRRAAQAAIRPVECLSVCKRPCTIGFSAAGKWTYVYGDFTPDDASAEAILDAAALYAATPDGLIPWKERPQALKKGVVARIPPMNAPDMTDLTQKTDPVNAALPEAAE